MNNDTGQHDIQEMTLELLTEIRDRLAHVEEQQEALEKQIDRLTMDVDTVHKFQKSFAERLSIVEKFCVDQPLHSTPIPRMSDGRGRR